MSLTLPSVIARPTVRTDQPHRGLLPVVLTATFMIALDFFIVNVAIPSIQSDLRANAAALQWVVVGFGLAIAAGLITAGRLGDIYGRRRVFALGLALFTLASLICGIAPTAGSLIGGRVVQGLAAALMGPQVLAIVRTAVPAAAQARAFSMYGLTLGIGAVFGQLIGGLLIRADLFGLGWRSCFLINLLPGVLALMFVRRAVPESRAPVKTRLDLLGSLMITLALVALVLPLIQGREQGWPTWTWLSLGGAVVLLAAFGTYQRRLARRGGAPVVNPSLFRERAFTTGLVAQLTFWVGQASFFFVLALYLQVGLRLSALASGVVFIAIGSGYLATSCSAHIFARWLGRQVIAAGALIMVAGLALLWAAARHIGAHGGPMWLIPGLVIDGLGMGMTLAPLVTTVLARVAPEHAGAAAGVLSAAQQVGNAVGVAVLGIVFYGAADLGSGSQLAFSRAFAASTLCLVATELTLAATVQLIPRNLHR